MSEIHGDLDSRENLLSGLRKALNYHRDEGADDGGRLAAIVALDAVSDFIWCIQEVREERLHEPLANLKFALLDYQMELNPAMFRRPKPPNRPRDSTERVVLRAVAALAMEWLFQDGNGRKEAGKRVARKLNHFGYEMPGADKTIRGGTVEDWRDWAVAGSVSKELDADLFRDFKDRPQQMGSGLENAADNILDWLHTRYPPQTKDSRKPAC